MGRQMPLSNSKINSWRHTRMLECDPLMHIIEERSKDYQPITKEYGELHFSLSRQASKVFLSDGTGLSHAT